MNFKGLMKQAQEMQKKLKSAQHELVSTVVTGEAGGGIVKIEMNGRHDVSKVEIDPSVLKEDREVIQDLIAAAINDAARKVEKATNEKMKGLASGFQIPEGFDKTSDDDH